MSLLKALAGDYLLFALTTARALLLLPLLLMWLGPEGFGLWALALALAGWLDFGNFSVAGGAIRRIAEIAGRVEAGRESPEALRRTQASASGLFMALGVLLSILALPLAWLAPVFLPEGASSPEQIETVRVLLLLMAARVSLGTATQVHASILYARRHLHEIFAIQIVGALASFLGSLWVIALGGGLIELAAIHLASFLPEPIWCWRAARRRFPEGRWKISRDASRSEARAMLGVSGWLAVASVAGLMQSRMAPAVLAWSSGLRAVTILETNARLWQMGLLLLRKLPSAIWPRVSESAESSKSARNHLKAMAFPTLLLASAGCAGCGVFARDAMEAWLGPEVWIGWPLAIFLGARAFLSAGHHVTHTALLAAGKTRAPSMANLAELLLALPLLLWMASVWGAAGAAAGVLLAHAATAAWFNVFYFCRVFGLSLGETLARAARLILASALPAAGVALWLRWLMAPESLLLVAALGCAASAAGVVGGLAFGTSRRERAYWIAEARKVSG